MTMLALGVVFGFCLFLLGLAVLIVVAPVRAERFLGAFAGSARAHYLEQVLRLLVGTALLALADRMRYPAAFTLLGGLMAGTTLVLLALPWRWHQRFAQRVMPSVFRHMRLFALGVALLAVFILHGLAPTT